MVHVHVSTSCNLAIWFCVGIRSSASGSLAVHAGAMQAAGCRGFTAQCTAPEDGQGGGAHGGGGGASQSALRSSIRSYGASASSPSIIPCHVFSLVRLSHSHRQISLSVSQVLQKFRLALHLGSFHVPSSPAGSCGGSSGGDHLYRLLPQCQRASGPSCQQGGPPSKQCGAASLFSSAASVPPMPRTAHPSLVIDPEAVRCPTTPLSTLPSPPPPLSQGLRLSLFSDVRLSMPWKRIARRRTGYQLAAGFTAPNLSTPSSASSSSPSPSAKPFVLPPVTARPAGGRAGLPGAGAGAGMGPMALAQMNLAAAAAVRGGEERMGDGGERGFIMCYY